MDIKKQDNSWDHLYYEFRDRLEQVLRKVGDQTEREWMMTEGYRSPERQMYLYGSGRPQLGSGAPWYGRRGNIVTWKKTPTYHGTGCAADCYPIKKSLFRKQPDYNVGKNFWETYREIYHKEGLSNPAWSKGDYGHVQLSDMAVVRKARLWIRKGFQNISELHKVETDRIPVRIYVNGDEIKDAGGYFVPSEGLNYMRLRPVAEELDWVIVRIHPGTLGNMTAILLKNKDDDLEDEEFALTFRLDEEKRGVVRAGDLIRALNVKGTFDRKNLTLRID